ncbi:MAG: hypothetical protein IPM51_00765 [Sphingobacteriaceae bacterium]|nr:hypothetical protein [Sphingobacteriaceae bacterium]
MKKLFNIIFLIGICSVLLTCKKYDEGGWIRRTCKNLFGGNKVGDSKTWKLKKYEVNGIDSTYLINTGGIPDFYEKTIKFTYNSEGDPSIGYLANTFVYEYSGKIVPKSEYFTLGMSHWPINQEDSAQCKSINSIYYCSRNLLFPELKDIYSKQWMINKLTKNELIIVSDYRLENSYKLIFVQ